MAINVLGATPKIIDTLKKADKLVNNQFQRNAQDQKANISIKSAINSNAVVPVRVISGDGVNGYLCNIYENGLTNDATRQGIVFLANGNSSVYVLPAGTIMFAQQVALTQLGTVGQ